MKIAVVAFVVITLIILILYKPAKAPQMPAQVFDESGIMDIDPRMPNTRN